MSATLEPQGPPRPESSVYELFDRRRLLLFVAILLVELGVFAVGVMTPLSGSARADLGNQANTQFSSIPTANAQQLFSIIFSHNLAIGLVEMIPILGALMFVYSIYITGLVAQVIAVSIGYPSQFGVILFIFPYSLVELSAYAIAVGSGVMLLVSWRRGRLGRELKVFVLEVVSVAIVLGIAALMETVTRFSPFAGLALWVPTGIAIAAIYVYSGRKHHEAQIPDV